jgi:membrane-bound lytic murein transglycosylase F
MNKISLVFLILLFTSCENRQQEFTKKVYPTLAELKKEGKLTAITSYSPTSYFLYRGTPMGFEYELLTRYADYLGVELDLRITDNIDSMFCYLQTDSIDLAAHGFTITTDRKDIVDFTDYLYLTHQVLVQRKPENWRQISWSSLQRHLKHDAIELIGDTVSVRINSSYLQRLANLSSEIGGEIIIDTLPGNLSTDEIIKMVVDNKIKYTIADDNIAKINASYYPELDVSVPISFSQRVAWALNKNSDSLKISFNKWLAKLKDDVVYYVLYNKYFENQRSYKRRIQSEFLSLNDNKISKYDDIIQQESDNINWDWRLIASLIYQESGFDNNVQSWAGASGLMQLMPETAAHLGVDNILNPESNIKGGIKYLADLYDRFAEVEDTMQRKKFALASYNCGYAHVLDAMTLAEKRGLDKNKWDNNTEKMILELSYPKNYNLPFIKYGYVKGDEPYTYVRQIFERYEHYLKFIQ